MKKFIALLMALCMVFALCACGGSASDNATTAPAADTAKADDTAADDAASTGNVHIGIVTGSVSQSEDDRGFPGDVRRGYGQAGHLPRQLH